MYARERIWMGGGVGLAMRIKTQIQKADTWVQMGLGDRKWWWKSVMFGVLQFPQ